MSRAWERGRELADALRRQTREDLTSRPAERWADRRSASAMIDYLAANPDLLDPEPRADWLELLFRHALGPGDNDVQFHSSKTLGEYLSDRAETPMFRRLVDRTLEAYGVMEDYRPGCCVLSYASARRDSWIRARLERSSVSAGRKNLVDLERRGAPTAANVRIGLAGNRVAQAEFLERAAKASHLTIVREDPAIRRRIRDLLGEGREAGFDPALPWTLRAVAADLLACSDQYDGELTNRLFEGMKTDPESEVRLRMEHAYATLMLLPDGWPRRPIQAADRLIDELSYNHTPAELRYSNGAIVEMLEPLGWRLPETHAALDALLDRIQSIGRDHPEPYNRKTAIKVLAKLVGRWRRRPAEELAPLVEFVLEGLEDPVPDVRQEAFLSLAKRGWDHLLTEERLDRVLDRLPTGVDGEDAAWVQTLACMLPEMLRRRARGARPAVSRPAARHATGFPEGLTECAVRGGRTECRLVSLVRTELPDFREWAGLTQPTALLELGRRADERAPTLFREALPRLREAFADGLPEFWTGVQELCARAGAQSAALCADVLPKLPRLFGDRLAERWPGIVRLGQLFPWERKPANWFLYGVEGLARALRRAPHEWELLLALGLLSGKHFYKLYDNIEFLAERFPADAPLSVASTVDRLARRSDRPYEALRQFNVLVWNIRRQADDVRWDAAARRLAWIADAAPPDQVLRELASSLTAWLDDNGVPAPADEPRNRA